MVKGFDRKREEKTKKKKKKKKRFEMQSELTVIYDQTTFSQSIKISQIRFT